MAISRATDGEDHIQNSEKSVSSSSVLTKNHTSIYYDGPCNADGSSNSVTDTVGCIDGGGASFYHESDSTIDGGMSTDSNNMGGGRSGSVNGSASGALSSRGVSSDSADEDDLDQDKATGPLSESEKRRDKRRRYRRRKRDRDLQEELLVRQQHVVQGTSAEEATPTPTVWDAVIVATAMLVAKPLINTPPPDVRISAVPGGHIYQQHGSPRSEQPSSNAAGRSTHDARLPYGHGQGQGVGHNPDREDCSSWHFAPEHYDMSRPLYVRVCGLKAAVHIDSAGVIWLNLSQLMKLVGKTKKQTLDLYGEHVFDASIRTDVKLLDLKDGPKASAYVSEVRARQLVIPFMGPTKSTNFLAELDRIHREFRVPNLEAYDAAEASLPEGGPVHTPLYMRKCGMTGYVVDEGIEDVAELPPLDDEDLAKLLGEFTAFPLK